MSNSKRRISLSYATYMNANPSLAAGVNPETEREPPPAPTLVYFPQNDVDLRADEKWADTPPNLFQRYSHVVKPIDVRLSHLRELNVTIENEVPLETLLPVGADGVQYLPPRTWNHTLPPKPADRRASLTPNVESFPNSRNPMLGNGAKAPDQEAYAKCLTELTCENEDALRSVGRRKARPGHPPPTLSYFRKFWGHLELVFAYWDSSLDHYYDANDPAIEHQKAPKGLKRLSVALGPKDPLADAQKPTSSKRYTGRRISTGSKMPENLRIDATRTFVEPLAFLFGCQMVNPKRIPQMEIRNLLIPVTQTSQVWRIPQDRSLIKRGITEGPILGIQCRAETGFLKDKNAAALDTAREVAGLLLLAQERAREGRTKVVPGQGKWYTTKPRWGGGPGGEFGDAEGNTDSHHGSHGGKKHSFGGHSLTPKGMSEEEIWKQLKPGPGLWDPRHIYLAVGKERGEQYDNVFMISSLFHHIAILKLQVHPLYIDYLVTGKRPASPPPDTPWHSPKIQRSPWYDLLLPEERAEALRALWGVMSYSMRTGETVSGGAGHRQKSEVHHHFPFRKKSSHDPGPSGLRSASVAF